MSYNEDIYEDDGRFESESDYDDFLRDFAVNRIPVLYRENGKLHISQMALDEYNRQRKMVDVDAPILEFSDVERNGYWAYRSDPLFIKVCKELGSKFTNDPTSMFKLYYIREKYKNDYIVETYKGHECINIEYDTYAVNCVKKITDNLEMTNRKKCSLIQDVLDDVERDWCKSDGENKYMYRIII